MTPLTQRETCEVLTAQGMALLANGYSGRWGVTLIESANGVMGGDILQIEGPAITLACGVESPETLSQLHRALQPGPGPAPLLIGRWGETSLELRPDRGPDEGFTLAVGSGSRLAALVTLRQDDAAELAEALRQAILDLD